MTKDVTPARLRLMRERTGMTQGEVANLLHISQQSYSAYETSRVPPADLLVALCRLFRTSADYLLGLTDDRRRA